MSYAKRGEEENHHRDAEDTKLRRDRSSASMRDFCSAFQFAQHPLVTEDGLPHVFAINTLAPYILTALIQRLSADSARQHRHRKSGNDALRVAATRDRPARAFHGSMK